MNAKVGLRTAGVALAVAACAAVCGTAGEANYQPYIVGERAAGMGGAVAATAEGMDACFYNPAGLAREQRSSISINGTVYGLQNYSTKDASFPGEDLEISSFVTIPTGLSAVQKLKDGTAAAFSVFVPSQTTIREIQAFRKNDHYYNYSQDEQTLQLGPSIGHVVNDRLSVGASVFGIYQTADEFDNLYWGDYSYTYSASYKYTVIGAAATVGAQYRLTDEWFLGGTLSSPSATISGSGRVQVSEAVGSQAAAAAEGVYLDDLDADNGIPAQGRLGLGWRRAGVGSAGLDVTHHLGRRYHWMDGKLNGESFVVEARREPVTDVQLGGEYIVRKRYPVRAGAFTSFSSAPDLDLSDTDTPDKIDLWGLTASVGSIGENVILNFGVSYVFGSGDAFGNRLDADGNLASVISGTKERCVYFFASTAYRF